MTQHGILKDLFDMELKGNFISNILSDREFNVRFNSTYCDIQEQEAPSLFHYLVLK
jgi:hypothetical protein